MKKVILLMLALSLALVLANCDSNGNNDEENKTPVLSSLSPSSCVSHMPTFTLAAYGSNFTSNSKIIFDGQEKETLFVNSTKITCQITPNDTLETNSVLFKNDDLTSLQDKTATVFVRNPSAIVTDSNSLNFSISSNHTFTLAKNISNDMNWSATPIIATDNSGNINVVWQDWSMKFLFKRSTDNGSSWSNAKEISPSYSLFLNPDMAVDGSGNIYVAWKVTFGNIQRYFCKSTDGGNTWSQPATFSDKSGSCYWLSIAAIMTGNIYVIWQNYDAGTSDIFYSRSNDYGVTWSTAKNVSNSSYYSSLPALFASSTSSLLAVWVENVSNRYKIYFSRSSDGGENWSLPVEIADYNYQCGNLTVAMDSKGKINVMWEYSYSVYYSSSVDNGASWSSAVELSGSALTGEPAFVIDSADNINVVWSQLISGDWEIYYIRSIDGGITWTQPMNISNLKAYSHELDISIDPAGNINIVWNEWDKGEVYYSGSSH